LEILDIKKKLDFFNDGNFVFNEESHTYSYDSKSLESVTKYIKKFKKPFEKMRWAQKKAAERGIPVDDILNEWQNLADVANMLGTNIHQWIEDFFRGKNPSMPEDKIEIDRVNKFLDLFDKKLKDLEPIAFECRVFSKKWGLAGTMDSIFLFKKKYLLVGDWKTNKEFKDDSHSKGRYNKLLPPFSDLYENNLNEYSIQTNLYRLMLEEAGIITHGSFLVHIGPEGPAKMYKCLDLKDKLREYMDSDNSDIFDI
jgi:hypothetical protein